MTGVDAVHSSGARRAAHPQHASGSISSAAAHVSIRRCRSSSKGQGGTSLGVRCRLVSILAAEIT